MPLALMILYHKVAVVSTGTIPDIPELRDAINKKWNIDSAPDDSVPRMYVQDVKNYVPEHTIPQSNGGVNGRSGMPATLRAEMLTRNGESLTVEEAEAASGFGIEGAKALVDFVDKNRGVPFSDFSGQARLAYLAGTSNEMDFKAEPGSLQEALFEAGRRDRAMSNVLAEQNKPSYVVYNGKESGMQKKNGKVVVPKGMSKIGATAFDCVGQELGLKMQPQERIVVNDKGREANAAITDDGIFKISLNSNLSWAEILGHEPVHRFRQMNTPEYHTFVDFAVQMEEQLERRIANGEGYGMMFEYIRGQYEGAGLQMNAAKNVDEIAARFAQRLFGNEMDAMMIMKKATQNRDTMTAMEKLMDLVQELIWKLQRAWRRLRNQGEYAAAKELGMTIKQLEQARKLWAEAYKATANEVEKRRSERESGGAKAEKNTTTVGDVSYALDDSESSSVKEQLRKNQDALDSMDAVASTNTSKEFKNAKEVLEWAKEQLKQSGYKVERQEFGMVIFDEKRLKNGLNYLKSAQEYSAFAFIPKVIKRGIIVGEHINHKSRGYDTITFAAPVEIDGVRGNMAVVVRIEGKNYYKLHKVLMPETVLDNKKRSDAGTAAATKEVVDTPTDIASINSISQPAPNSQGKFSDKKGGAYSLKDDMELSRGNISATPSWLDERIRNGEKITLEDAKAASGYGDYGAEVLAGAVNNAEGQTFSQVKGNMHLAYLNGRVNKGMRFETDLQREAYYAGKKDAELGRLIAKKKAGYATVYGKESGFIPNDASKNVSPKMQKVLNLVAKDLGVKVMFVDNIVVNKKGDQANAAMGDDGIFRISASSTQPLYELIIHEPFHRMRQLATQEYFDAMNFAVQHAEQLGLRLEQGNGAGTYYEALNNLFTEKGISHDDAKILDELAAQFYQKIVSSDADALRFIQEMNKTEKSRNALEKFMDYVKELIGKLQKVVRKLRNQGEYAAAKQMDMTIKELETARKFYKDAYRATRQRVENRRVEQTWDVKEDSAVEKNTNTEVGVSYSFKESFGTQLEDWRKGNGKAYGSYNGKFFELGTTPDILVRHGAPEGEVIMFEDCLAKIAGLKHSISLDEIAKIPAQLNDPILLFKGSHENSFVALTEVKAKNGHDVIVAIHINKKLGRSVINKIASVYSKTDDYGNNKIKNYVMAQISAGNLLDASTKKAPTWFTASGLQLPHAVQTIIDANNSISQNTENSQGKFSDKKGEDLSLKDGVEVFPGKSKADTKTEKNTTAVGDVSYSLREIVDEDGKSYGIGVVLDSVLLENLTPDQRVKMVKDYVKKIGGKIFTAYEDNGNAVNIRIAKSTEYFKNHKGKNIPVNRDLTSYLKNETKQESITLIDELIVSAKKTSEEPSRYSHGWLDNKGENYWDYWTTYIQDKDNAIWEAVLNIANSAHGEKILYDIFPIKKVGQSVTSDKSTTNNSISQNTENSQGKFSDKKGEDHSLKDGVEVFPGKSKADTKTEKNTAPVGDVSYSLREIGGKNVVWIEESGLTNKQLNNHQAVAEYIAQHIGEVYTIIESGQKVYIGEDLPGEYTQSKYTSFLRGVNQTASRGKNRAIDGLGELIETATNRRWEKTKHTGNKDAKYGMYRYDNSFAFPIKDNQGNISKIRAFDVELLIRNASDGNKYLYDIVGIKENTTTEIDLLQRETRTPAIRQATRGNASNNNISQTSGNSQEKFSTDLSLKDEVEVSPKRTKELLDTIAYLKGQFETTKFAKADPKKLRSMTRKLLKEYSSNLDLGETTTAMDELYRYMANGENGHPAAWDETFRRAKEIATRIAESALETDNSNWVAYEDLRNYLRSTTMYIRPDEISDARDFNRRNMGRMRITTTDRTAVSNYQVDEIEVLDVLYAVNAKKKNQSSNEAGFTDKSAPLIKGSSTISISNLLELVKNDFSDVMTDDVLKQLGVTRKNADTNVSAFLDFTCKF